MMRINLWFSLIVSLLLHSTVEAIRGGRVLLVYNVDRVACEGEDYLLCGLILAVEVIAAVLVVALLVVVFVPLHWWMCGCINCLLPETRLHQDPVRQHMSRTVSLEQQWKDQENNRTTTIQQEGPGSGSYNGSSRLTLIPTCCFRTKAKLELTFHSDGTVSGTKHMEDAATTTISGRWFDNKVAWLETGPAKKTFASGSIIPNGNGTVFLKGDFYASKQEFGKYGYKCANVQEPPKAVQSVAEP